ncbi:MAG: hypothetical protein ACRD0Q_04365 [Acidimicrobiales bacterium]
MSGAPRHPGNRIEVLRNGATLEAMLAAISSATATIDLSSYIYWPGPPPIASARRLWTGPGPVSR